MLRGNKTVGILREVKNKWERRAPLAPSHVKRLVDEHGLKIIVQPCTRRVYSDEEYRRAGAELSNSLDKASLIVGVKEVPINNLLPDRTYMFFSHTIKAQPSNMALLDAILKKNIRLVDYETIVEGGVRGNKRLVAFGKYAGIAGMIDTFRGLGERLLSTGYGTPFLGVSNTFMYPDLKSAKDSITKAGQQISDIGTPKALGPLTFVFTGNGNVSQGAQEMFKLLPHEMVDPKDLAKIVNDKNTDLRKVYGTVVAPEHYVKSRSGGIVERNNYYENPDDYYSVFHEVIAPYTSVLMNCMYWEPSYPRILTNSQQRAIQDSGKNRLIAVGDITCDINGSVEFLSKPSSIEVPFYLADVEAGLVHDGLNNHGVMMLGVDNLPAELPKDATEYFGNSLSKFIPALAASDGTVEFDRQVRDLPKEIHGAIITDHGKLTPDFSYIEVIRRDRERMNLIASTNEATEVNSTKLLLLRGHLFDSNLINSVLDQLEHSKGVSFKVKDWVLGGNREQKTSAVLELKGESNAVTTAFATVQNLVTAMGNISGATIRELPFGSSKVEDPSAPQDSKSDKDVIGKDLPPQKVFILGSGMVSAPMINYLYRMPNVSITLASNNINEAKLRAGGRERIHPTELDVLKDVAGVSALVKESDLVISMVPAPFHTEVAKACIRYGKNMITASYVSPAMRALHSEAADAGITILSELGLDPGIDHMSAMSMIDDIHNSGGKVDSFFSVCGGLPAPEAANNPLGYKFSWSPRGVLTAGLNDAKYLIEGRLMNVDGKNLFQSAKDISFAGPSMALEHIPNRDSLPYQVAYKIPEAKSIYRGTLRYKGFCEIMGTFSSLGLFSMEQPTIQFKTWGECMKSVLPGCNDMKDVRESLKNMVYFTNGDALAVNRVMQTVDFLELLSDKPFPQGMSNLDALCVVLQKKLAYGKNERDMVLLQHKLHVTRSNGKKEIIKSSMFDYGIPGGDSAMSRTVGLPVGIAASLMLQGKLVGLKKGVTIPTSQVAYKPILELLADEGVRCVEEIEEMPEL